MLSEFNKITFLNTLKIVENIFFGENNQDHNIYGYGYGDLQRFTDHFVTVRASDRCTDCIPILIRPVEVCYFILDMV